MRKGRITSVTKLQQDSGSIQDPGNGHYSDRLQPTANAPGPGSTQREQSSEQLPLTASAQDQGSVQSSESGQSSARLQPAASVQDPGSAHILANVPSRDISVQTDSLRSQREQREKLLWHVRLGGLGSPALDALARQYPSTFRFSPGTTLPSCHCCQRARARKANAPPAAIRPVPPLQEVHFDFFFAYGDIILYLIDRGSLHEWVYFLDHKSDLPKRLQQWLIDVNTSAFSIGSLTCSLRSAKEKGIDADLLNQYLLEHNLPQCVKVLYSDNEGTSAPLEEFLFDMHIAQRFSVAGSQHQNALSENNGGWQLFTAVRHDLDLSNMSKGFRRA